MRSLVIGPPAWMTTRPVNDAVFSWHVCLWFASICVPSASRVGARAFIEARHRRDSRTIGRSTPPWHLELSVGSVEILLGKVIVKNVIWLAVLPRPQQQAERRIRFVFGRHRGQLLGAFELACAKKVSPCRPIHLRRHSSVVGCQSRENQSR